MKALLLIPLMLCSCMMADERRVVTLGGKVSYNGRNFSVVSDHEDSFQAGAAVAGIAIGAYGAAVERAGDIDLAKTNSNNATKQAINASNNAVKTTEITTKGANEALKITAP